MRPVLTVTAVLAASVLAVTARAEDITVSLKELTDSELIVLARVVRVEAGEPLRFARLEVEVTWKGRPPRELWMVASPTWTCDHSWAEEGQRAVFFLHRVANHQASNSTEAEVPNAWKKSGHEGPVFRISGEGRGALLLRERDGTTYVEAYDGVRAPEDLKRVPARPSGTDRDRYLQYYWWATLSDLEQAVRRR